MRKTLSTLAGVIAVAGALQPALAHDAMTAKPTTATMVCREARATEKSNAMMNGKTLVCKTITKEMMAGPQYDTGARTPDMLRRAWQSYIDKELQVPPASQGN